MSNPGRLARRGLIAVLGITLGLLLITRYGAILTVSRASGEVSLERVFPRLGFERPLGLLQAPGRDDRWFVVEQRGTVLAFANDAHAARAEVFVDIRGRVEDGPNEAGLLGMAFHPDFSRNGQVFLSYTRRGSPLVSTVSRFISKDGGRTLEPRSEMVILSLAQPYGNHNGGNIAFGPDGMLYIGFGDGGAGGDPQRNGQNTATLLGTLLRIDVDGAAPYAVPPDNPFAAGGGRPEIYAWGLRNPWGWSFDQATGELWLADVGQGEWEEVNRVRRGGNYGWNIREGAGCFEADGCDATGLIEPLAAYSHAYGCSITGGHVYRGRRVPALDGAFIYGDYCSGRIWGLFPDGRDKPVARLMLDTNFEISAFGQDGDGEVYVVDHGGGGIYRLAP